MVAKEPTVQADLVSQATGSVSVRAGRNGNLVVVLAFHVKDGAALRERLNSSRISPEVSATGSLLVSIEEFDTRLILTP